MRVLHIGYGFRPWRSGGLIEYAEDLMAAQVERGHQVSYFFSGRQYPLRRGPSLRRWSRGGVRMFEVVNSPVIHGSDKGTMFPESSLEEPRVTEFLRRSMEAVRPQIVHIQELAGLPSSVIEVLSEQETPALMTLQDYFLLCPTLKLLDWQRKLCIRKQIEETCPKCCQHAPRDSARLVRNTVYYDLGRLLDRLPPSWRKRLRPINEFGRRLLFGIGKEDKKHPGAGAADSRVLPLSRESYQRRREVNIGRLNQLDLLVAQSRRVAEIYHSLGVSAEKIRTVHLTVDHLQSIRGLKRERITLPIQFAALNVCISQAKGAVLLLGALSRLDAMGLTDKFHLHVWGGLWKNIESELLRLPSVTYHGWYKVSQLDAILNEVHVGVIPSIWEEAFGYVGPEFLAKGVPIIGNALGGILDYTRDGQTGWVNRDNSADGLASIIASIIREPQQILKLNHRIVTERQALIKTMPAHCEEMEALYRESINRRRNRPVG